MNKANETIWIHERPSSCVAASRQGTGSHCRLVKSHPNRVSPPSTVLVAVMDLLTASASSGETISQGKFLLPRVKIIASIVFM